MKAKFPLNKSGFVRMAAAGAAVAAAAVFIVSLDGRSLDGRQPSRAPQPGVARTISGPVAQTYSAYCQTPQGVCVLPSAEPIGSTCECDGTPGRVIP